MTLAKFPFSQTHRRAPLAVAGAFALLGAGGAQAATTRTVCASGCDFTTIQAAINASNATPATAADRDIVAVQAGSYAEAVTINRPLRVLGAQANVDPNLTGSPLAPAARAGGESVITSTYAVSITASDVEFNGFELTGFRYGVNIPGPFPTPDYKRQNITIAYNWIHSTLSNAFRGVTAEPGLLENLVVTHNAIELQPTSGSPAAIGFSGGTSADGHPTYKSPEISYNWISGRSGYGLFSGADPAKYLLQSPVMKGNYFSATYNAGVDCNIANMTNGELTDNLIVGSSCTVGIDTGTISGNTFAAGGRLGLWGAEAVSGGPLFWHYSNNLQIANNNFLDELSGRGITIDPYAPNSCGYYSTGVASINAATIAVHTNAFRDALVTGHRIRNLGLGTLDAVNNWWDSANGTTGYVNGCGGKLLGLMTTAPALTIGTEEPAKQAWPTPAPTPSLWPLSVIMPKPPGFWPASQMSITFDGDAIATSSTATLKATVSAGLAACASGASVTFAWTSQVDANHKGTATVTANASGYASTPATLVQGELYDVTVSVATWTPASGGGVKCLGANDEGATQFPVAPASGSTIGGGWYKVSKASPPRVNFGYNALLKTDKSGAMSFSGNVLWINTSTNRLKGKVTKIGSLTCPTDLGTTFVGCALVEASGTLYDYNASYNPLVIGSQQWINPRAVTFTFRAYDGGLNAKKKDNPDAFGMQINGYDVPAESAPALLGGGLIYVK